MPRALRRNRSRKRVSQMFCRTRCIIERFCGRLYTRFAGSPVEGSRDAHSRSSPGPCGCTYGHARGIYSTTEAQFPWKQKQKIQTSATIGQERMRVGSAPWNVIDADCYDSRGGHVRRATCELSRLPVATWASGRRGRCARALPPSSTPPRREPGALRHPRAHAAGGAIATRAPCTPDRSRQVPKTIFSASAS